MAIDYSVLPLSKGTPRIIDRIAQKQAYAAQERATRLAVKKRDHGRCVVPGCREASRHLHHIQKRSQGGTWRSENIASLCVRCHQLVHANLIQICGDADVELVITGDAKYLRFSL